MQVEYIRVNPSSPDSFRDGFVEVYQEAFSGPPYFETYTSQEVADDVWLPHLSDPLAAVVLARVDDRVVGFGCAQPFFGSPDQVQAFVNGCDMSARSFDPSRTWYMSDLGVLNAYRNRGIGYGLVRERMRFIMGSGGTAYVLRTDSEASNSAHLYRTIGAVQLPGHQDVSQSDQVTNNGSQSKHRIYFHGLCDEAMERLRSKERATG